MWQTFIILCLVGWAIYLHIRMLSITSRLRTLETGLKASLSQNAGQRKQVERVKQKVTRIVNNMEALDDQEPDARPN